MVYYQSTPLNIKSEQPSQTQLCMQTLQTTTTTTALPPSPPATIQQQMASEQQTMLTQTYGLSNVTLNMQQMSATQSISNAPTYLGNIKNELLPPSITVYSPAVTAVPNESIGSSTGLATQQPPAVSRKVAANKPQFKCEQCGMTFGSKSAHTSHTKSHAKNGEYNLNSNAQLPNAIEVNEAGVPLGIPKTPQIKPNANAAAGGDPYQCNVCQKTFAVPARLIRHYRTHTGERPFECEFCHKLFSVKENLQVHRRIHTKERPYKCEVCGRAFEHSGKLHRHMRIHTGERPHKCSVCEKTFIQSGQLVIHMRTHTGEKPYKCPVEGCGKGFTCSKQLKVHSRTHTGEKPYHCDICFRDFGYNHVLKLHRVQHYGSKCYKCTICDETFKSKKEMEAHIKGHANEMPDDEDEATNAGAATGDASTTASSAAPATPTSTVANSSGAESNSPPNSPQSPGVNGKAAKAKKPRQKAQRAGNANSAQSPPSPGSPSSSYSPSSSSFASASRLSAGSPTSSSIASPPISIKHETDHHSRDSGVASATSHSVHYAPQQQTHHQPAQPQLTYAPMSYDDMPTDLRVPQQQSLQEQAASYYHTQPPVQLYTYAHEEHVPEQQEHITHSYQQPQRSNTSTPTINSVLLEAASIRRIEEDVTQAAMQIMQLHRSQQQKPTNYTSPTNLQHPVHHASLLSNELAHYDDTHEANELIEHYKRGDLARHVHGYAPVPKFESAMLNNEIIVRQVEAAIAPLRSSTESPERSSSPESDSMLMADRDVMTLPLRKRKVYMSESANSASADANSTATASTEINGKVMRMSSVIQFAKAT